MFNVVSTTDNTSPKQSPGRSNPPGPFFVYSLGPLRTALSITPTKINVANAPKRMPGSAMPSYLVFGVGMYRGRGRVRGRRGDRVGPGAPAAG